MCVAEADREGAERAAGPTGLTWVGHVMAGQGGVLLHERGAERKLGGFEHRW